MSKKTGKSTKKVSIEAAVEAAIESDKTNGVGVNGHIDASHVAFEIVSGPFPCEPPIVISNEVKYIDTKDLDFGVKTDIPTIIPSIPPLVASDSSTETVEPVSPPVPEKSRDKAERWKALLEKHNGNISRAAKELGVSSPRGMKMTKDLALNKYAAELRVKNGGLAIGRPPQ